MSERRFLSIPLDTDKITRGERLERCDLETSIRQNLRLLLTTPPLRVRHDPVYQCKIHWNQFLAENGIMEEDKRKEDDLKMLLENNIKQLIERFEPRIRLNELTVSVLYPNDRSIGRYAESLRSGSKENNIQIIVQIKAAVVPEYQENTAQIPLKEQISLF